MIPDKSKKGLLKTFLNYSIPCIMAMFLTSAITLVDGLFIGNKFGGRGLAAVNLTMPVLYLMLGIAIMIGIGGVTIATHSMGAKDMLRARQRFTFTVILNAVFIVALSVILKVFIDDVVHMLNAKGELQAYVKDYLGTMSYFFTFMMANIIFSMFIRGEGKPKLSLMFGIISNIINIILDYLFIFVFDLGIKGAAYASGIAVIISSLMGLVYFLSGKSAYRFVKFRFNSADFRSILFNGSSEFIGNISISITNYLFNYVILSRIGIDGVAAFTIVGYVSFIQSMIITGIAQGLNPLVSFSFGARDRDTIMKILAIGIRAVIYVGIGSFILSLAATELVASLFVGGNSNIVSILSIGLRVFAASFLLSGYNFIASAYFTSLGDAKTSATIAMLRSLILVLIFLLTLPPLLGDIGIWLTIPLTEAVTFIYSYVRISKSRTQLSFSDNPVNMASVSES